MASCQIQFGEASLRTRLSYSEQGNPADATSWLVDGDHPTKGSKEAERVKEGQEATKDAKGIQAMVRNLLF